MLEKNVTFYIKNYSPTVVRKTGLLRLTVMILWYFEYIMKTLDKISKKRSIFLKTCGLQEVKCKRVVHTACHLLLCLDLDYDNFPLQYMQAI